MGIFDRLFNEMNSRVDEAARQTLGIKSSKKKHTTRTTRKEKRNGRRVVVNVYKEIHNHRHFHDYKNFKK